MLFFNVIKKDYTVSNGEGFFLCVYKHISFFLQKKKYEFPENVFVFNIMSGYFPGEKNNTRNKTIL